MFYSSCLHSRYIYCLVCAAGNDVSAVEEPVESLQFDFATIEAATNNFSENNKLGKGGFGDVYKVRD